MSLRLDGVSLGRLRSQRGMQANSFFANPARKNATSTRSKLMISLPLLPPESCDGCGLCCEGIGSPVLLYASRPGLPPQHPFRPADLPQNLIEEIDHHFAGLTRGQEPQDRCLWFDPVGRACLHYEFRPQICRDYELGARACLQRRRDELGSTSIESTSK